MIQLSRRNVFVAGSALAGLSVFLQGCGANAATINAQIVADINGLVPATKSLEAALALYAPNALTPANQATIATLESAAQAGVAALSSTTPVATGATVLQTVEHDINEALSILGAILPTAAVAIPALVPFVAIYDAAVALVTGVLEPYIATLVTPAPAAASTAVLKPITAVYAADQARAKLGIPTVAQ